MKMRMGKKPPAAAETQSIGKPVQTVNSLEAALSVQMGTTLLPKRKYCFKHSNKQLKVKNQHSDVVKFCRKQSWAWPIMEAQH